YDIDPSDPNRKVKHKKINTAFLKHQRWKAEQERLEQEHGRANKTKAQSKPESKSDKGKADTTTTTGRSLPFLFVKWSLVAVLCAFGLGQFIAGDALWGYRGKYVQKETFMPPTRMFTPAELAKYDGKDELKPIYLSILGHVYDVTPGKWVYGPKGSYHFFAGRDASRAFVTGCFHTPSHLSHDLRGLNKDEVAAIEEWKNFFDNHQRYKFVGKLDLPRISKSSPIPKPCNTNADK
ncbi:cytochrome b5, partial [Meira miltonrushii]